MIAILDKNTDLTFEQYVKANFVARIISNTHVEIVKSRYSETGIVAITDLNGHIQMNIKPSTEQAKISY